jgi:hypothetical protein
LLFSYVVMGRGVSDVIVPPEIYEALAPDGFFDTPAGREYSERKTKGIANEAMKGKNEMGEYAEMSMWGLDDWRGSEGEPVVDLLSPQEYAKRKTKEIANNAMKGKNGMDLMTLQGEWKTGKVLNVGKSLTLLTPVARLSFPALVAPEQYQGTGAFKFGVDHIFETGSGNTACVDFKSVMLKAILDFAKAQEVPAQQLAENGKPVGIALGKSQGHPYKAIGAGGRISQSGKAYDGYSDTSVWLKASSKPKVQSPPWTPIPCISPTRKRDFPADKIYGGCYGRSVIQAYRPASYNMIVFGLVQVQFLADGEAFGSEGLVVDMTAAPGAVDEAIDMSAAPSGGQPVTDAAADAAADAGDFSSFM